MITWQANHAPDGGWHPPRLHYRRLCNMFYIASHHHLVLKSCTMAREHKGTTNLNQCMKLSACSLKDSLLSHCLETNDFDPFTNINTDQPHGLSLYFQFNNFYPVLCRDVKLSHSIRRV